MGEKARADLRMKREAHKSSRLEKNTMTNPSLFPPSRHTNHTEGKAGPRDNVERETARNEETISEEKEEEQKDARFFFFEKKTNEF